MQVCVCVCVRSTRAYCTPCIIANGFAIISTSTADAPIHDSPHSQHPHPHTSLCTYSARSSALWMMTDACCGHCNHIF